MSDVTFMKKTEEYDRQKPPCAILAYDERNHKTVWYTPAVNCNSICESCGWNPEVKKIRIARMLAEKKANQAKAGNAKSKKGGQ